MADTFFGFDTSLPVLEAAELDPVYSLSSRDLDVDKKNDETFGAGIVVGSPSTSHLIENGSSIKKRTAGMSIKDILTQEYQKSKEVVSLEEELQEEEIIENSISQLGLDDDIDEKEIRPQPKIEDDGGWTIPPKSMADSRSLDSSSLIQDILSPDRRGIWASPERKDDNGLPFSAKTQDEKQPDLLKQIFNSAPRSRPSPDVVMVSEAQRPSSSVNVIKAEDLEKGMASDHINQNESSTPVIIERRMPRAPGPPPGFPFPLGTPPSGMPWMPRPGMMPMSPMMMTSQMQRMLAASPHMALFGGMPPGGMPPRPPHGFPGNLMPGQRQHMQNTPGGNRGRYQHGFQQQRRWESGNNRYHGNQQKRQWNRSDDHHYQSHDDEVMKLSPSNLMTSREKEWLVKIQLMTLLSDDAYTADYYYVSLMNKKATKMVAETTVEEQQKKDTEKENFNKLLDIVEQKKEERKYRPAVFEGSLGKLTVATVHHPRQLVDVSSKDHEEEDQIKTKGPESAKKRFIIYGAIEKAYAALLDIEDIDRRLLDVPDPQRDLLAGRIDKIDSLFNAFKLSADSWQRDCVNELFVQMMCIAKGKKLFLRSLQYFTKGQAECACLSVISSLQILTKKDTHDKILLPFIAVLLSNLRTSNEDFLCKVINALLMNNLSQIVLYSFGLNISSSLLEHLHISENDRPRSKETERICGMLKKDMTTAVNQISVKSMERHSLEINRLKSLLSRPDIAHAFEE